MNETHSEVDLLLCPACGGAMRITAFIEGEPVIRKILEQLKLWEDPDPRHVPRYSASQERRHR